MAKKRTLREGKSGFCLFSNPSSDLPAAISRYREGWPRSIPIFRDRIRFRKGRATFCTILPWGEQAFTCRKSGGPQSILPPPAPFLCRNRKTRFDTSFPGTIPVSGSGGHNIQDFSSEDRLFSRFRKRRLSRFPNVAALSRLLSFRPSPVGIASRPSGKNSGSKTRLPDHRFRSMLKGANIGIASSVLSPFPRRWKKLPGRFHRKSPISRIPRNINPPVPAESGLWPARELTKKSENLHNAFYFPLYSQVPPARTMGAGTTPCHPARCFPLVKAVAGLILLEIPAGCRRPHCSKDVFQIFLEIPEMSGAGPGPPPPKPESSFFMAAPLPAMVIAGTRQLDLGGMRLPVPVELDRYRVSR